MKLHELLDLLCTEQFKVVTFRDYAVIVLYNSRKTTRDVPAWMNDSIVESYDTNSDGLTVVEI